MRRLAIRAVAALLVSGPFPLPSVAAEAGRADYHPQRQTDVRRPAKGHSLFTANMRMAPLYLANNDMA